MSIGIFGYHWIFSPTVMVMILDIANYMIYMGVVSDMWIHVENVDSVSTQGAL